jgi:hypothetical protein
MRHAVDYRMILKKNYRGTIRKFTFLNIPSGSEKHTTLLFQKFNIYFVPHNIPLQCIILKN